MLCSKKNYRQPIVLTNKILLIKIPHIQQGLTVQHLSNEYPRKADSSWSVERYFLASQASSKNNWWFRFHFFDDQICAIFLSALLVSAFLAIFSFLKVSNVSRANMQKSSINVHFYHILGLTYHYFKSNEKQ